MNTPYLMSVDFIEAMTSLDFLSFVPDEIEERLERVVQVVVWE